MRIISGNLKGKKILSPKNEFALVSVGGDDVLEGQRKYSWVE